MNKFNEYIPWVEKYRPKDIKNIVIDETNTQIINNILKYKTFPNLILFGPPGSGKTTTIINLIKEYQSCKNAKELIIHLNASDERGIDVIRTQIFSFVNSTNLFNKGTKYVILDEIDYMTKNAQQSLKYLIQSTSNDVVYCLICNYISKIDESLRNEFVKLKFNQLPDEFILSFLNKININENLNLSYTNLQHIQFNFNSDLRSMINFMQSNQHTIGFINILHPNKWDELTTSFLTDTPTIIKYKLINYSIIYNLNIKNILIKYINYIIKYKKQYVNENLLNVAEYIFHNQNINTDYILWYFIFKRYSFFPLIKKIEN